MSDETSTPPRRPDRVTLVLLVALFAGAVAMGWQEMHPQILPEGTPAPPLELARLDGSQVSLAALKGQVVVVNFWATWCPPCREEMPWLLRTVKDLEGRGVTLVAVSNDDLVDQRQVVEAFITRLPELRPYVALGRPEVNFAWSVKALPSVFILDRQGVVVSSQPGQASERQLREWIAEALDR